MSIHQRRRQSARLCRASCETLEERLLFSVVAFTVTTTADTGAGSLRQAILDSNGDTGQTNTIIFAIPNTDPNYNGNGVYVITPATPLPAVTQAVNIDGTSETGYSGTPLIYLTGSNTGTDADGLVIQGGNSSVSGLNINLFSGDGIEIDGASSVSITANFIGTDYDGKSAQGNGTGIQIDYGSKDNTIGGTAAGAGNLISGNTDGVVITGTDVHRLTASPDSPAPQTSGNSIEGNYIGPDASGLNAIGNSSVGVLIQNGAQNNTIGTGNVISGNATEVEIDGSTAGDQTSGNSVEGNYIGTDSTGAAALRTNGDGVLIDDGAQNNTIGGTTAADRNIISGVGTGVEIDGTTTGPQTTGNIVEGNYLGTDVTGAKDVGIDGDDIFISAGAQDNTIGGTASGAGNVISDGIEGVVINGTSSGPQTSGNFVEGNLIGTNAAGTASLSNSDDGILVDAAAQDNTIGGTTAGAGNVISGNTGAGVEIQGLTAGPETTGNAVEGNLIGTDSTGKIALGNGGDGIEIDTAAQNNTIGGATAAARNVISGNSLSGIEIVGIGLGNPLTSGNIIEGNYIGIDITGSAALGNTGNGIGIIDGTQNNTIGGTAAGAGNVVSGNADGIAISGGTGLTTSGNLVEGNFVGTDYTGATAVPNTSDGVFISGGAQDNTIGGAASGDRNIISGNQDQGVGIDGTSGGAQTNGNFIEGNYIGVDNTGEIPLANGGDGVLIDLGAQDNTVGGSTAGARNVISGNSVNGVEIDGTLTTPQTSDNVIEGNYIGYDAACIVAMGNSAAGVFLESGASDNIVGGSLPAEANDIVYNGTEGVGIGTGAGDSFTVDNLVRLNSIFGNTGLGIDLGNDGVTANAPGTRSGPNDFQNYPVLTSATSDGVSSTTVQGSLNTLDSTQFVIDFYSTPTLGPGSSAQGKTYLGSTTVTTDGSGNATFDVTFPVGVASGQYITATATTTALAPYGDTSEFSAPVQVTAASSGAGLTGTASPAAAKYNLTAIGTSDWAAWGRNGNGSNFNHDAAGGSQISNVTKLGPGSYGGWADPIRDSTWTNGTPTASDSGDDGYIWANNAIGAGYSFTVPAGTTKQTLTIYLGGFSSGGTLNAHLSDGSSPDYNVTFSSSSHYTDVVTITFKANSPGQTLTLTYAKSQTIGAASGSVDLMAAWLAGPPAAPVVVTNPQSQSVTVGTPVTFTAAATGTPAPTVQWEISTNGGTSFSPILGATSTTLSIGTATLGETGDEYEAIFTNAATSTATTAATLTVSAPTGGLLTGTPVSPVAGSYNLTALGTADWAHWGRGGNGNNFDHDRTGGSQISNVTRLGPAGSNFGGWSESFRGVSWTNGTPTASDAADHGYIWANDAAGAGFSFTVPAGTATHTLYVYFGGFDSNGTINASLSDGSAFYPGISFASASNYTLEMAFTFHAASPGQTLTISITKGDGFATSGSIDLIAAWLQ